MSFPTALFWQYQSIADQKNCFKEQTHSTVFSNYTCQKDNSSNCVSKLAENHKQNIIQSGSQLFFVAAYFLDSFFVPKRRICTFTLHLPTFCCHLVSHLPSSPTHHSSVKQLRDASTTGIINASFPTCGSDKAQSASSVIKGNTFYVTVVVPRMLKRCVHFNHCMITNCSMWKIWLPSTCFSVFGSNL